MIELCFFEGTGFASALIEWFSAGPFSHVAAVWSPDEYLDARSDVIGGVPAGVRIRSMASEAYTKSTRMRLMVSIAQETAWRAFLFSQLKRPYDKPGIVGFAFERDWREDDSWFCSELQAAALEEAGICPDLYAPANKITPSALATIFSALGAQIPA